MSRIVPRRWTAFLGGFLGALVLIFAILLAFTRTEPGRERILKMTLETLGGQLRGELQAVRLEGDLFTGARMYEIVLRDTAGLPMVTADSAYIDYRLATFFGGDVVINRLVLYDSEVHLYRLPGDSLWNYQAVLQDTIPDEPGRRARATVLENLELVEAEVTVRIPWEPADELSGGERERMIEGVLSDTSRLAVERVPGGYLRTVIARMQEATVEALTVAPDERGGTYLRVVQAIGLLELYRGEPLRLEGLEGELSLRDGVMRYRVPTMILPGSRLTSLGVVDLRGDDPAYDLQVSGEDVALRDMQWLYPAFPDEGEATFALEVETQPDGLWLRATNLTLAAPRTRLTGQFGLLVGDSMLFSDISLRADPLDVNTIERMLPVTIPVRGLRIGSVEIRSPAS